MAEGSEAREGEVIPRPLLTLLLVIVATLGAVEATPKEVTLSVSTEPFSASPLNTLPAGTSQLLTTLARMGYDVRVYADVYDLVVDAPKRVAVVVVAPEVVTVEQVELLASYASKAEYFGAVVLDERMQESGSISLAARLLGVCGFSAVPSQGEPVNETLGVLYLAGNSSYPIAVLPLVTVTPPRLGEGLDAPPFRGPEASPPAPPYTYRVGSVGVEVLGFAYTGDRWSPLSYLVDCPASRLRLAISGDSDFARNYLANVSSDYLAHAVALVEGAAGPPGDVVVAFIMSFYVNRLSLSTVLHPSFLLSLLSQLYAAVEPRILESLTGWQKAAMAAALSIAVGSIAAGYTATLRGGGGRGGGQGAPGVGRTEVLAAVESLCTSRGIPRAKCGRLAKPGIPALLLYTILGWERYYVRALRRLGG